MKCDHIGCTHQPTRGPRLIVCSKTWLEPGHDPIRMMTTLHYCEAHKGELKLEDVMTARQRRRIERVARYQRPKGYKCDFDTAFLEFVLVTTPEYRRFVQELGMGIMHLVTG